MTLLLFLAVPLRFPNQNARSLLCSGHASNSSRGRLRGYSGLSKPVCETGLAKLSVIAGHDAAFAQLSAEVKCFRVSDNLARIAVGDESLLDQFVETEHIGP